MLAAPVSLAAHVTSAAHVPLADTASSTDTNGPVVGVLALLVLLLICRFVFGTGRSRHPRTREDFGLLVAIASLPTRAAAEVARERLTGAGIRATLADQEPEREPVRISADGHVLPPRHAVPSTDVLVFPADADRARVLLTSSGPTA